MAKRQSYPDWLKEEFGGLIETLALSDAQKRFLRSRWLDQVAWMEGKASETQRRYYQLRLTTVIGAVVVPALVSLEALGGGLGEVTKVASVVISLIVAVSAAIEQFFDFGGRWQHYRQTVERLKTEGWSFFQLSGRYHVEGATHSATYPAFAERVEEIIQSDVEVFVTEIAGEKERQQAGKG